MLKKKRSDSSVAKKSACKIKLFFGCLFSKLRIFVDKYIVKRCKDFMSRRPHRSFRRSYRRDYVRSLKLPGYISFTNYVWSFLRKHRGTFLLLIIFFALVLIAVGAITSQENYTEINKLIQESGEDLFGDGMGKLGEAGLLAVSSFLINPSDLTSDQQIYLGICLTFVWLATVWLLREYMAGRKPRLRDGLYNSGAPVLATFCVLLVLIIQLFPVGIIALLYIGLLSAGILSKGFGMMIFGLLATAVCVLVLFWITSTLFALTIVTLPGMYPLRALKASGDIVTGRRLRIMYRWIWGVIVVAIFWLIVMVPVILIDTAIKSGLPQIQNWPIVPFVGAFMMSGSIVWFASYVYLLYRKVVEDDAKPA